MVTVLEHEVDAVFRQHWGAAAQAPILTETDFLILTLALTDETYHMMDAGAFAKMKPGAFLVNMARGGVVCTPDPSFRPVLW